MNYHILVSGKRMASFVEETDRDICLDALVEYWGEEADQLFTTEEGE
ncbi:hypothetical protein KAR91_52135 [Candidatus Pacearchaeota archaeon]|nr:hypothetical protein [Candidatus Pacearchaeota archaeon]